MDVEAAAELLSLVPHFHAYALGNVEGKEYRVSLDMFVGSIGEAEDSIPGRIEELCRSVGLEFDPEEWALVHLAPVNVN